MKQPQFDSYSETYGDIVKKSVGGIPVQDDFYLFLKIEMLTKIISELPKGAKILDFGSGIGTLVIPLSKLHTDKNFYAFDVSLDSLNKISEQNLANIECLENEEELFSEKFSSKFDFIFCINVFHHIDKAFRLEKSKKLKINLTTNGRLLILEHNPLNPLTRLVVSRCSFDEGVELLGKKELVGLFKDSELNMKRHWYILFFPFHNKFFLKIEKLLSPFPVGAQQCIIGTKSR